jgi:hypothetical protein
MTPVVLSGSSPLGTVDLVSSAPGIFDALLKLVRAAAAEQSPPVSVFPFELGQYEPAAYVMLSKIENHVFEWESIGVFAQKERYEIQGKTTVFSGDSAVTNPTLATTILAETYALFQACVMTPAMSNRNMPILNTEGPTPYLMLPGFARYDAAPGNIGGGTGGWCGVLDWSLRFEAIVIPA